MIVDFDAYIGDFWPGREMVKGNPHAVKKSLEKAGIHAAFTALLEGPWYRDTRGANEKLAKLAANHRGFFLLLACIDPTASYWKEDVDMCLTRLGMAGVRLYPQYHHYALDDARTVDLCRYLGGRKAPVFITMLAEEDRFAHPAVRPADPKLDELTRLIAEADGTTFVVNMAGGAGLEKALAGRKLGEGRVFFDTGRMDKDTLRLDELIAAIGHGSFVFGSHAPFFYPVGSILNLAFRTLPKDTAEAILQTNFRSNPDLKRIIGKLKKPESKRKTSSPAACLMDNDWRSLLGSFYGRLIDQHAHFTSNKAQMVGMIEQAKRAGFGTVLLNGLGKLGPGSFGGWQMSPTVEQIIRMNMAAIAWCKKYPDFLRFVAYINPRLGKPAVEHVERWAKEYGAVGLKIHACKEDGSIEKAFPVIEKAVELGLPVLFHTFFRKGGNGPAELSPLDIVEFAKVFPDAKLIAGHFGGDWVRTARTIEAFPNIYGDTSGCTHRSGFTEYGVRTIGAERILLGVDMWCRAFGTQIGKIVGADITKREKELILFKNQERIFRLGPPHR
jgi:predicted TIM-barrel fold metal-dependent hydrolase